MPTIISGDTGIDKIAAGAIEFADLPTGSVLQVVQGSTSTLTGNTTTTFADTTLTASITPKFSTSKILVLVSQNGSSKYSANTAMRMKIVRGSTQIMLVENMLANDSTAPLAGLSICLNYLDSPATTSSTTYKTQFANQGGTGTVYVQDYATSSTTSTITLLEIAG
jgi:hypothetical protein